MKIKITERIKDKLFNREVVKFEIDHEGEPTPTRVQVREALKKELGEHFVIKYVKSTFGFGKSVGEARAYKSKEEMFEYEPKHLLMRDGLVEEHGKEEKGKQEEGKEEAKQETPQRQVEDVRGGG